MEARAGLDVAPSAGAREAGSNAPIAELQRTLDPQEVLLAFHSGAAGILLLGGDARAHAIHLDPRAARTRLRRPSSDSSASFARIGPAASGTGAAIYDQLFGGVDAALLAKPMWIVAPDGPLFELPFSALIESGTGAYVVERHAIREVPGIWAGVRDPRRGVAARTRPGPWVGVGDPIYNRADTRRTPGATAKSAPSSREPIELPRLTGSGREVEACARIWRTHGLEPRDSEGRRRQPPQPARRHLEFPARAPHRQPHSLPTKNAGPGMLAVSAEPAGAVDLLSASEIARLRADSGSGGARRLQLRSRPRPARHRAHGTHPGVACGGGARRGGDTLARGRSRCGRTLPALL